MIIGVDIGGMSYKFGVVDNGKIICKNSLKFDKSISSEESIVLLSKKILKLLDDNNISRNCINGIGIGCPGAIDSVNGVCDLAYNLGFDKLPICDIISQETGFECKITNDANAAALGEVVYGAAKDYQDAIMITLGTGVGGGIIINKKIYDGNQGKGAELGHSVIKVDGRRCTCGRKGCLEAYASASALIYDTKIALRKNKNSLMWKYIENNLDNVNGKTAFECAKSGDEAAEKVINNYVKYLGEGLLNLMNEFRPQAIVIGGGLSLQKEYLINRLKAYCEKYFYGFRSCPKVELLTAELGNDAGIIGASCLML